MNHDCHCSTMNINIDTSATPEIRYSMITCVKIHGAQRYQACYSKVSTYSHGTTPCITRTPLTWLWQHIDEGDLRHFDECFRNCEFIQDYQQK